MSVIFIDGPDFSGKTTTAKAMGNYSEWSITRNGQACRKYFESAKCTQRETIDICKRLWSDWMSIGADRKTPIHVDRSPLSTYAEQIVGDDDTYEEEFIDFLVREIEEKGPLHLKFISVSNEVITQREAESTRVKDKREKLRSPTERNTLYHIAFERFTSKLTERCKVTVQSELDSPIITLIATTREESLLDYFTDVTVATTLPGENIVQCETLLNSRTKLRNLKDTGAHPINECQVVEALDIMKEWLITTNVIQGVTIPHGSSIVMVGMDGNVLTSTSNVIAHDHRYDLVDGFIKRIRKAINESKTNNFTYFDVNDIIGHHQTKVAGKVVNPYASTLLAALFLVKYKEEHETWNIV